MYIFFTLQRQFQSLDRIKKKDIAFGFRLGQKTQFFEEVVQFSLITNNLLIL